MIKQEIILIYIIINLVVIISVLGVGITIFKQKDSVNKPHLTQGASGIVINKKLAKIGDIKADQNTTTIVNKIQLNQVDLNITEPGKEKSKTSNTKPNNGKDLNKDNNNIRGELGIIEEVPQLNTSSDKESQEIQLSDDVIRRCLAKIVRGYDYQDFGFVFKNIYSILDILKLTEPKADMLDKSIKTINVAWENNEDKIINQITDYPSDLLDTTLLILKNVNNPGLMYHNLSEFLFLCIPRPVEEVLTDAFSRHISLIELFTEDDRLAAYNNNKQLKDLYLNNLQGQLFMFIEAINLINNYNNEIIGCMKEAIKLRVSILFY